MKSYDDIASFDWGRSIGEVRRMNHESQGDGRGTGLRGSNRISFDEGLRLGFEKPRGGRPIDFREKSEQSDRLRKYAKGAQ